MHDRDLGQLFIKKECIGHKFIISSSTKVLVNWLDEVEKGNGHAVAGNGLEVRKEEGQWTRLFACPVLRVINLIRLLLNLSMTRATQSLLEIG